MSSYASFTETLGQLMRDPLGQPTRVHKDESGLVLLDVSGNLIKDVAHLFRRRDGFEIFFGKLNLKIEFASMTSIHHVTVGYPIHAFTHWATPHQ